MDAVKEDIKLVSVTEKNAEDMVRWHLKFFSNLAICIKVYNIN